MFYKNFDLISFLIGISTGYLLCVMLMEKQKKKHLKNSFKRYYNILVKEFKEIFFFFFQDLCENNFKIKENHYKNTINQLKKENKKQKKVLEDLKKSNNSYKQSVNDLKKNNKKYKRKIAQLKYESFLVDED